MGKMAQFTFIIRRVISRWNRSIGKMAPILWGLGKSILWEVKSWAGALEQS